eukprot:g10950.t1
MCEIFYPYKHLLKAFSDGFKTAASEQTKQLSFLQTVASRGGKLHRIFQHHASTGVDAEEPSHVFEKSLKRKKRKDSSMPPSKSSPQTMQIEDLEETLFSKLKTWLVSFVRGDGSLRGPKGDKGEKGDKDDAGKDGSGKIKKSLSPEIKQALEKRAGEAKLGTKHAKVDGMLRSKASYYDVPSTCPRVTGVNEVKLVEYKQEFCPVHKHIDLGDDVANIAMVYIESDINPKHKNKVAKLMDRLKFVVEDACQSSMFTQDDISVQKIASMKTKRWVALVRLDSTSKGGYLQSQLAQCKSLDYISQTSMSVKVELEVPKYCKYTKCVKYKCSECVVKTLGSTNTTTVGDEDCIGSRMKCMEEDKNDCLRKEPSWKRCGYKRVPYNHHHTKRQLEYAADVIGTQYFVKTMHKARRRLLWHSRRVDVLHPM